jgi:hypothetical protein
MGCEILGITGLSAGFIHLNYLKAGGAGACGHGV